METPWESRYAQRTQRMSGSAIRELLKLTEDPEIISFGGGMPAPDVFPVDDFRAACDRVLAEIGPQALQYGATEGYRPLREMIALEQPSMQPEFLHTRPVPHWGSGISRSARSEFP